ncbi:MAG TPA: SCP2 sterol-binding domain-containing protein [Methylomirabilota bacterium]|nr:SCP2 sterol-binding domain-containing protein [Methylomirabilota bacterium]
MPTVTETMELMPTRFKADRAQGVNAVIQYEISGDGGGTWHLTVKDGTCTMTQGPAQSPTLTLAMSAQDWLDMIAGKLSGQMAFMQGKLKLKGDMGLAMKIGSMFGV